MDDYRGRYGARILEGGTNMCSGGTKFYGVGQNSGEKMALFGKRYQKMENGRKLIEKRANFGSFSIEVPNGILR